MSDEERKTDEEWRQSLSPEQFRVCREKGTEAPFTGDFWNSKDAGTFSCVCCGEPLFRSEHKFDSGTGWPSFWQAMTPEAVATKADKSHGMVRVEALCQKCGAHLGHLFPDGPQPTGLRYCINSVSLKLDPDD